MQNILMRILLPGIAFAIMIGSTSQSLAVTYPPLSGLNEYEWITSVNLDGHSNDTGAEIGGYHFYSSAFNNVSVLAGFSSHGLQVTIQPDPPQTYYIRAFFDWNQDGDFSDIGETINVASNVDGTVPYQITFPVPVAALGGKTRMRIALKWNDYPPSTGNLLFGEAEDYEINVIPVWGQNYDEWITNVTFGGISNTSGYDDDSYGYGDYTNITARVHPGKTYPLSVTFGDSGFFGGPWYIRAFFDWNQDNDFNDPSETVLIASAVYAHGPHTANVSVPSWALQNGKTRMRVVLRESSTIKSNGDLFFGEAEDYSVAGPFPWNLFLPAFLESKQATQQTPPAPFTITSTSFSNNQVIPIQYTLYGTNISPQLSWQRPPAGTTAYMLTVIDPDGGNWLHWKVKLPGTTTSLAANAGAAGGANLPAGSIRFNNDFLGLGIPAAAGTDYDGPRPPSGTGIHHYIFRIAALNSGGSELASASITGTYTQP